ncbi:hypothetical protein [Negativibacillus massiliensis]|uniref:hypothetical protein n=1 Tax=Negativibacillus massiliensis TaxID=1871035 RepID=UPI003AF2418A
MKKERNIAVVLLLTLILITLVILCLLLVTDRLGALSQSKEEKQETMIEELEQKESQNLGEEEEPTEEELLPLFEKAMNEIISLATNPTDDVLRDIFDKEIECDYMNQVIIDDIPYQWTSRQYSELVDYYSQTFTGEALDWLLDTSFTDVDGVLYAFAGGGATGWQSKAVSVEKLDGNTYKGTYLAYHSTPEGEEESTIFSIEKTDAGYRVSDIAYHPDLLERRGHRTN